MPRTQIISGLTTNQFVTAPSSMNNSMKTVAQFVPFKAHVLQFTRLKYDQGNRRANNVHSARLRLFTRMHHICS